MNFDNVKELTIGGKAVTSLSIGGVTVWLKEEPTPELPYKLYDILKTLYGEGSDGKSGLGYINTNIIPTIDSEFEICQEYDSTSAGVMFGGAGTVTGSTAYTTSKYYLYKNTTSFLLHINNTTYTYTTDPSIYNNLYVTYNINSSGLSINNIKQIITSISTIACKLPLLLFFWNNGKGNIGENVEFTASAIKINRIKYFKNWESGELKHHFVPCQLTQDITADLSWNNTAYSSGEIGMWDLIENKFYGNCNTHGYFIVETADS